MLTILAITLIHPAQSRKTANAEIYGAVGTVSQAVPLISINSTFYQILNFFGIGSSDDNKQENRSRPANPSVESGADKTEGVKIADPQTTSPALPCTSTGVTLNVPSGVNSYPTIQAAINAANPSGGDTIQIAAGTYTEQLVVNKCVFIDGAGQSTTIIQSPTTLATSSVIGITNTASIVEIRSFSYVTMSDLTVTGPVPFTNDVYGIYVVENATLEMDNARVTAIHQSFGIDGVQRGNAVRAGSVSFNQIGFLDLNNVTIDDYQKTGIIVSRAGSSAVIDNSTLTGAGAQIDIGQNGIQINDGATATITDNTIIGNVCDNPACSFATYFSYGIIALNTGAITITGNTFANNDAGTYTWATTQTISENTFNQTRYIAVDLDEGVSNVSTNFINGGLFSGITNGPRIGINATSYVGATGNTTATVFSNSVTNTTQSGIELNDFDTGDTFIPTVSASFTRLAGNLVGIDNNTTSSIVSQTNNFWGCNLGPNGGVGCDTAAGLVNTGNPYLLLKNITTSTASVNTGGTATVTAFLTENSAGTDTYTATNHLPNPIPSTLGGIPVNFSSNSFGSVAPATQPLFNGQAQTTFTGGGVFSGDQTAVVTAQVDNATDSVNIIVEDTTAPTVTINQAMGQPDPANAVPVNFTAVFNEVVTGFTDADIDTTGSTATIPPGSIVVTNPSMDGMTFNVAISPTTSGFVTVSVPANAALDPASNGNTVSTSTDPTVSFFVGAIELVVDDMGANCLANASPVYTTIQAAVAASASGYVIRVCPGTYPLASTVNVGLTNLTIIAAQPTKPVIQVGDAMLNNNPDGFNITATGVTLEKLEIVKLGTGDQHHMVRVQANNFTGKDNYIHGPSWQTPVHVSRAYVFNAGVTGFLIDGNTFENLRQPGNTSGGSGTVSNSSWMGTKGWVNDESEIYFDNNTMTTCAACDTDIALLTYEGASPPPNYVTYYTTSPNTPLEISQRNNNAHIDVQFTVGVNDSGRAISYVNATTGSSTNDGRTATPYASIQQAIFNPASGIVDGTLPGGTVNAASGTYNEDVNVDRTLNIIGAGASTTTVSGPIGGSGATFQLAASNINLSGFTITRAGNNITDWNNPGLNTVGVAIQGLTLTGNIIHDNIITGNRNGVDVNSSNGHTFRNNVIDTNRTGMIYRNQTDDSIVVENTITNNFTVGILFLDASVGSNVPVQTALNSAFINNNLSGNWYGQIVDRQTGGSLPAPGGSPKNFQGNWFGTTTPVVTTANSAEPGYAAQIPVIFGGSATAPGGQPDIAGPASANFRYTQVLTSGTDTNVETTTGRGTNGFQGAPLFVNSQSATGWGFFDDFPGMGSGSGDFAIGPMPAPLGQGSARLSVDANGRQAFGTVNYRGIRLDRITKLRYSSYQTSANLAAAPTLQFDVDSDLTDGVTGYQGRLVYEPNMDPSNTILQSQWQTFDAFSPTARFWGSGSGASRPFSNSCPQSAPCDLATVLNLYPNIGIRAAPTGTLLFKAGGPTGFPFVGYVDKFDLGISTGNTTFDFEPGRPTVTINQAAGQVDPTNTSPINFTAVFSTAVTGFTGADVALSGTAGATTAVVTEIAPMDGTTYNVAVSGMATIGTVIATIVDSAATSNPPGNGGPSLPSTSTDNTVTWDNVAPTVTASPVSGLTNNPAITFTVNFNEVVTGFGNVPADYTVFNGTVGAINCSGNPTVCTVAVTATLDGAVTFQVNANAANDPAGNGNTVSNTASVTYDGTLPTVIVEGVADPDTTSPVDFTVTFSELVTGFTASDAIVTGSAFTGTPVMIVTEIAPNDGTTYNVAVSGMNQTGNVVVSIPANSVIDVASNGNTVSTAGPINGNDVQFNLPNTAVVVNPTNTGPAPPAAGTVTRWWGFNDVTDALTPPSYVEGPATPLAGIGSAGLNTTATGKYLFFSNHFNSAAALPLSQITNLRYSSYAVDPSNAANLPSLQIGIDFDSTDVNTGFQGRMVFEPTYNTAPPNQPTAQSTWQTWDATNGEYWFTQAPGNANCTQALRCTRSQILTLYPDINIPNTQFGFIGFRSTGGGVNAVENYVDNFIIGINSVNTTFDFEPTPPTVSISNATAVTEGDSGTITANFTVSLNGPSQLATTVQVSTANGTATTADNDYVAVINQVVTIPAGMTSAPFTVSVNGDNLVETDEGFFVNLSNASNAAIDDGQGTGTITNDDAFGTLQFSSATYSVTEGIANASITVTRTGGNDQAVSVDCSTVTGGSATGGGTDYTTVTNQLISFADQDSANKTCSIPITNDNIFELAETVNLSLSGAVGAALGSPTAAVLTINDNGNFILISGNIQQYNAPSPNTNLAGVTVTLSGSASDTEVTDANGNYTFNGGLLSGTNNYLVVPSLAGKVFDPINRSYVNLASNVTNADFVAYNTGAVPRNIRVVNTSQLTYTSNVTVPIVLDSLGTENAMSFSLNYNSALLDYSSITCGTDAPGCSVSVNDVTGMLGVEFTRADVPVNTPTTFTAGNGRQVVLVTFTTTPGAAFNTPVTFGDLPATRDVNDVSGNSVPTNYVSGLVIFAQGIEGDVAGRTTGNGSLGGPDVTVLRQFVSGALTPDPTVNEFQRADVAPAGSKGNGSLGSSDVTVLRGYLANSIITPVGGPNQLVSMLMSDERWAILNKRSAETNAVVPGDVRVVNMDSSPGSSVSVPIHLQSAGNENGVTVSLQFDSTKLTYTGAVPGPDLVSQPNTTFDTNVTQLASGRVSIILTLNVGQSFPAGVRNIIIVNFTVAPTAPVGLTPISFINSPLLSETNDTNGDILSVYPNNFITGNVNILASTSANASVGGKLVSVDGSGIGKTTVTIIGSNGATRSVVTNSFGNYTFTGLPVGETYVIRVNSKKYRFTPETRTITVNGDATDVDFTAENQ